MYRVHYGRNTGVAYSYAQAYAWLPTQLDLSMYSRIKF